LLISHQQKITQWTHPRTGKSKRVKGDLPLGWVKKVEQSTGKMLFIDSASGQTTYTDPRLAFAVEEAPTTVGQLRQRFDASTGALQILHGRDLSGKVAIITGANSGIGFETARSLALHGCTVILACRNEVSTLEAIEKISKESPLAGSRCRFVPCDLTNLWSVREFARTLKFDDKLTHIDILILNAGVFALPYTTTSDRQETTFQVCHLSHFYLTQCLSDMFDQTSRIVCVSSESHRFSNWPTTGEVNENMLNPLPYQFWSMMAYNNAKLCNVLFVAELARVRR
jgi:WW domain-containing oxidoreductase